MLLDESGTQTGSERTGAFAISTALLIAQAAEPTAVPGWWYFYPILLFSVGMLIWDTVEVGRNDAVNLVNAVYGSRVLPRRRAVQLAGLAVVIGAMLSSDVMETARKGIFKPGYLDITDAIAIYASVYIVDTVLLYGYSAFAMPVSTTASLVFELLGAAVVMSLLRGQGDLVQWPVAGKVITAIIVSVIVSGIASFLIQRIIRGAIRDRTTDLATLRTHGTWVGGGMATGLVFFMLIKGMSKVQVVAQAREWIVNFDHELKAWFASGVTGPEAAAGFSYGMVIVLIGLWVLFAALIHGLLRVYRQRAAKRVFPVIAVIGMVAMAIAFGQNDLANCASPGLATITLLFHWEAGTAAATKVPIAWYMLLGCGVLLFLGMRTKNAVRVTKAGVEMGSHNDRVQLYAPQWCLALGERIARRRNREASLAPRPARSERGKRIHFDALRASTIMCVSASVIAFASSYGWPVSTTYVTFAAIVGSGMGDKIYGRGDAGLKVARSIWVFTSWFLAALIAATFTGIVCLVVAYTGIIGLVITLGINLYLRRQLKRRGDAQIARSHEEMLERAFPERYAEEDV